MKKAVLITAGVLLAVAAGHHHHQQQAKAAAGVGCEIADDGSEHADQAKSDEKARPAAREPWWRHKRKDNLEREREQVEEEGDAGEDEVQDSSIDGGLLREHGEPV